MTKSTDIKELWKLRREHQRQFTLHKRVLEDIKEEARRLWRDEGVMSSIIDMDIEATEKNISTFRIKMALVSYDIKLLIQARRKYNCHKHIPHYGMFA